MYYTITLKSKSILLNDHVEIGENKLYFFFFVSRGLSPHALGSRKSSFINFISGPYGFFFHVYALFRIIRMSLFRFSILQSLLVLFTTR